MNIEADGEENPASGRTLTNQLGAERKIIYNVKQEQKEKETWGEAGC